MKKTSKPATPSPDSVPYPTSPGIHHRSTQEQVSIELYLSLPSNTFFRYSPTVALLPTANVPHASQNTSRLAKGTYDLLPCTYLQPLGLPFGVHLLYPTGTSPIKARNKGEVLDVEPYGYAFTNIQGCHMHSSFLSYSATKPSDAAPQDPKLFVRKPTPLAFRNPGIVIFHEVGGLTLVVSPIIGEQLTNQITSL